MSTQDSYQPKIIGIICNWCCYGGADLCGVSRFQYPPHIRLVRVMCSARVDLLHIVRAFANGQDGVFVGGCHLCDCHYVTNGNFNAFAMVQVCKKMLKQVGVLPERLRIEWVSAGEGIRFANFMNEFGGQLERLGPLGKAEGIGNEELALKLEAVKRLIPYVKLVLTQKLRLLCRTEEAYNEFFAGEEFDRLFEEMIAGKLATSQIMLLLKGQPLSTGRISELLGLSPSAVSGYMIGASRQGLVRYDVERKCYVAVAK
ncbi:MAG: hydrogenase iron-sulfur subunit [Pseudomonadota bacterium]